MSSLSLIGPSAVSLFDPELSRSLWYLEVCAVAVSFFFLDSWVPDSSQLQNDALPTLLKFSCIPLGLSLILSMIFRSATIERSDGSHLIQPFVFLGACARSSPLYTPTTILLNRSVARPLVRWVAQGESVIIIFARALILSCIAVGIPLFGIYAVVISPIQASVYTRSVATLPASGYLDSPPGNVTVLMVNIGWNSSFFFQAPPADFSVNYVTVSTPESRVNCSVTVEIPGEERLVECPSTPWATLD
ncbi:hypothetical protein C8R45DRAFT_1128970 [Mycena sanguinolenta]|nr:hypothetical protein C8R45DRAFT_1128970 [Mycena sanguinolenta]